MVVETVERLSAVAQQKGLAFDVSSLSQSVHVRIQLTFFFFFFFFQTGSFQSHYSAMVSPGYTHKHGLNWGGTSYK